MSRKNDPEFGDIPELDDIVHEHEAPGAKPPPNLDLFGDASLDPSELRDALVARIQDEMDTVVVDIRAELDAIVQERLEKHLRSRLETLIDEILAERSNRKK
ncbi:MAG: hypothetical protein R3270_07870 [Gammaproteobacteria bacterium]|nr:hypothetical protein [Gammaproteobacteria bacterium]